MIMIISSPILLPIHRKIHNCSCPDYYPGRLLPPWIEKNSKGGLTADATEKIKIQCAIRFVSSIVVFHVWMYTREYGKT